MIFRSNGLEAAHQTGVTSGLFLILLLPFWYACHHSKPLPAPTASNSANIPAGHAAIYFLQGEGFFDHSETLKLFTWCLNDDTLRWRKDTLFFIPRDGIDTLTIWETGEDTRDFLYCDFRPDSLYYINGNACCGGFELLAEHGVSVRDTAVFKTTSLPAKGRWMGVAGHSAVWLKNNTTIPFRGENLLGPMVPRRYNVAIQPFQAATDSACFVLHPATRAELACFNYSAEPLFSMLYTSLHGDCPMLEFDGKNKQVRVRLAKSK